MKQALNGRHLRAFAAVMKSRNVAEAALKLGISEPAVSKTLRLLETETGVTLFQREGRRLKPTPAATALLPLAQRAAKHLDTAVQFAYDLGVTRKRKLVLAAHAPPLIAIVPAAVRCFTQEFPDVALDVRVESPPDVLRLVAHHEVDIGVTNPPATPLGGSLDLCERRTISEDLLVAALPSGHRLARQTTIRPADIADECIIALPDDSPTTALVEASFREQGVDLRTPIVAANSLAVCAMVQQGVGIGLVNPLLLATGLLPTVVTRRFQPRIALWTEVYHSALRPLSTEAERMIELLEQAAQALHHPS
jgi:DNA-binding transcriptional LysR family regulator